MSETKPAPQAIPMNEYHKKLDRRSFLRRIGVAGAALFGLGGAAAATNKDVQNSAAKVGQKLGEETKRILESPESIRDASFRDLQKSASGDSPSRVTPNPNLPPEK